MNIKQYSIHILLLTCLSICVCSPLQVSAQETSPLLVVNKSVRTIDTDIFSVEANSVRDGATVEFMIVVQNMGETAIPQVRVIDSIPNEFIYLSSDLFPDDMSEQMNDSSYLWILRAMEPGEQRLIKYKAKLDITAENNGKCYYNVANVVIDRKVQDSSGVKMCVVGGNNVLGDSDTQPDTAIMGSSLIDVSMLMIIVGIMLLFFNKWLEVRKLQVARY